MQLTMTWCATTSTRSPPCSRVIISVRLRSRRITSHQLSPPGGRK
jgi:hypothetical protein